MGQRASGNRDVPGKFAVAGRNCSWEPRCGGARVAGPGGAGRDEQLEPLAHVLSGWDRTPGQPGLSRIRELVVIGCSPTKRVLRRWHGELVCDAAKLLRPRTPAPHVLPHVGHSASQPEVARPGIDLGQAQASVEVRLRCSPPIGIAARSVDVSRFSGDSCENTMTDLPLEGCCEARAVSVRMCRILNGFSQRSGAISHCIEVCETERRIRNRRRPGFSGGARGARE